MTVPSAITRSGPYACNGNQSTFDYGFKILQAEDIDVLVTDLVGNEVTLLSGYGVTGIENETGGSVVFTVPPLAGYKVTLLLNPTVEQQTKFRDQGRYDPSRVEDILDRIVTMIQSMQEKFTRTVTVTASSGLTPANYLEQAQSAANTAAANAALTANDVVLAGQQALGLRSTSTSSRALGAGSRIFTTQAGKQYAPGFAVIAASAANPSVNFMSGLVTDYTGTQLTVNMTNFGGTGTFTDWNISVAGVPGIKGDPGAAGAGTGDMLKAQNLNDLTDKPTARGNLGLGSAALVAITALGTTLINRATASLMRGDLGAAASGANTDITSLQGVALDATSTIKGKRPPVIYAASGTLVLTDAGCCLNSTGGAATQLTIPANASVAFGADTEIDLIQTGAGQLSLAPDVGVTLRSKNGNRKLSAQYSAATLKKVGLNEWLLVGDLAA